MKTAFLFPGQGAQKVGMGQDLCEMSQAARDVFDRAEAVSNLPLKTLCFDGPAEELARTDVCQPAIFTVSAAALAVMAEVFGVGDEMPPADVTAGLSLGEYTALYAAGAMDLETAVRLVTRRGALMQSAAIATPSGMVSVLGLDENRVQELCQAAAEGQVLQCANFNCPEQIVVSGEIDACGRVERLAAQFGATGVVPLPVAGAFHSPLMQPAADGLQQTLDEVTFAEPRIPVIANIDAKPYASAAEIPEKLLAQLTSPVRWHQSMQGLLDDSVDEFYEIGPGRVLAGLMRRIHRKADLRSVHSRRAIEELCSKG